MADKNIYQKLIEVRKTVEYLQKDTVGYKYKYVAGATVIGSLRKKMDELGLILIPSIESYETENSTVKCKMIYKWVNADNPIECIPVPFACFGTQDDISKAFGSALTYSERYFLLKFFNIATDEDDPDAHQNGVKKNNTIKKETEKKPEPVTPAENHKAQFDEIVAKIDALKTIDEVIAFKDQINGLNLGSFYNKKVVEIYKNKKASLEPEKGEK